MKHLSDKSLIKVLEKLKKISQPLMIDDLNELLSIETPTGDLEEMITSHLLEVDVASVQELSEILGASNEQIKTALENLRKRVQLLVKTDEEGNELVRFA